MEAFSCESAVPWMILRLLQLGKIGTTCFRSLLPNKLSFKPFF